MEATVSYLGTQARTTVELPVDLPVAIHTGWGDRCVYEPLWVWTDPAPDGVYMDARRGARLRDAAGYTYDAPRPVWAGDFNTAVQLIRAAHAAAVNSSPDIAAAVRQYADIIAGHRADDLARRQQWLRDALAIARALDLPEGTDIEIGEQVVPGKVSVYSGGQLVGYADVWDYRWLGTVEHHG